MKKLIILTLFVGLFSFVSASNPTAIDYYQSGDLKSAKAIFENTPNKDHIDNYFLGLINLRLGDEAVAKKYFEAGLKLNPESPQNNVALAGLTMKDNKKAADKAIKKIYKKNKKDMDVIMSILNVYFLNNDRDKIDYYIGKSKKANKKSAAPYIVEGSYLENQNKNNEAAVQYENAIYFEPNSKIALAKLARLYVGTRKTIAFDYLDKATTIDPNYEYGWKTQAELRYKNGFYPEAKVAQENYMSLIEPKADDYQTYGEILYFNKDYNGARVALDKAEINTVTNRLKMYSYFAEGKFDEAIPYSNTLMTDAPKEELISLDYKYSGDIRLKNGEYEEAGLAYENAYEKDTTNTDLLKDAAKAYSKGKLFEKSVYVYETIFNKKQNKTMADYYTLGSACYSAGTDKSSTDSIAKTNFLNKADKIYGEMAELFPTHYLGYLSRARANSALDPTTTQGLAKPHYEKALEIMLPEADNYQSEIKEVYQYLGIYYLKTDQYDESKVYWEKVLELDPENAIAKKVIASIEGAKKK